MSVRRIGQRGGHSLGLTLSPEAVRVLGVAKGAQVVEVIGPEGTVELQPLTPPTATAARRRAVSARARELAEQNRRLRDRARKRYHAGYAEGFTAGFAKAGLHLLLDLRVGVEEWTALGREVRAQPEAVRVAVAEMRDLALELRALVGRRARRRPWKMLEAPWSGWSPRPGRPRARARPSALLPDPPGRSPHLPPPPSP